MAIELDFNGKRLLVCGPTLSLANTGLFVVLDPVKEEAFRQWARDQFVVGNGLIEVKPIWHPVVQDELLRNGMGREPDASL